MNNKKILREIEKKLEFEEESLNYWVPYNPNDNSYTITYQGDPISKIGMRLFKEDNLDLLCKIIETDILTLNSIKERYKDDKRINL